MFDYVTTVYKLIHRNHPDIAKTVTTKKEFLVILFFYGWFLNNLCIFAASPEPSTYYLRRKHSRPERIYFGTLKLLYHFMGL